MQPLPDLAVSGSCCTIHLTALGTSRFRFVSPIVPTAKPGTRPGQDQTCAGLKARPRQHRAIMRQLSEGRWGPYASSCCNPIRKPTVDSWLTVGTDWPVPWPTFHPASLWYISDIFQDIKAFCVCSGSPDQTQNATYRMAGLSWFAFNLIQIEGKPL